MGHRKHRDAKGQMNFSSVLFPPFEWRWRRNNDTSSVPDGAVSVVPQDNRECSCNGSSGPKELTKSIDLPSVESYLLRRERSKKLCKAYPRLVKKLDDVKEFLLGLSGREEPEELLAELQEYWDEISNLNDLSVNTAYSERFSDLMEEYRELFDEFGFVISDNHGEVVAQFIPNKCVWTDTEM